MTKEQITALLSYIDARIEYLIDNNLGRNLDYSASDQLSAFLTLCKKFGLDPDTINQ
jgi:hypothetical protein